ncbi:MULTISPECIES: Thoeris anti-defense Tad2 family protein [Olivibacter]|uniref:MW1434 family type I TA system toxin n=1 Tax=Olivibacter jilunii TaxID=985016 RepID=A0ABW6B3J3_9SPHI
MKTQNLTYYEALEAASNGELIARKNWLDSSVFAFQRPCDDLPINILLSAKSLPKQLKDYYERKHQPIVPDNIPKVRFSAYMCLKAYDDSVINGWEPSEDDISANDWCVLESAPKALFNN